MIYEISGLRLKNHAKTAKKTQGGAKTAVHSRHKTRLAAIGHPGALRSCTGAPAPYTPYQALRNSTGVNLPFSATPGLMPHQRSSAVA